MRNFSLQHVYREANLTTDCITNVVVFQLKEILEGANTDISLGLQHFLEHDGNGGSTEQ